MKKLFSGSTAAKLLLCVFFGVAVILPIGRMLLTMADADIAAVISSQGFLRALKNSLSVAITATAISVLLSTALAFFIVRSGIRLKSLFTVLFTLPMLIPSMSHGMGLIVLYGANGVITRLLGLGGSIYGFWGIVIGSVMYSFPVAFLMISDVLRYEDYSPYEAAEVLGVPRANRLLGITLPYLRRPMISVVFAVFTMIITDYGVPLMIGGQYTTLPVVMYQDVIGLLDFGKGSIIGVVLLIPALISFLLDTLNKDRASAGYVTRPFEIKRSRGRDAAGYAVCAAVGVLVLLPIAAFCVLTFVAKYPIDLSFSLSNITQALGMRAGSYLVNSLLVSVLTAAAGTAAAFAAAYLTVRVKSRASRFLHLMSIISLAVPGLVLGLSYVLFFKGSFLYGTIAILVMVNMVHFFSSPYLMMYNTFGKINPDLEAVGSTLGIPRGNIITGVLIPMASGTMLEMFSYFFVNSMMTISAVAFLSNINTKPISMMISQFEAQMMLECAAFVALVILAANLALKGLVQLINRQLKKRELA